MDKKVARIGFKVYNSYALLRLIQIYYFHKGGPDLDGKSVVSNSHLSFLSKNISVFFVNFY